MKLVEMSLLPRGSDGWGSGALRFGERVTSLFAPNGSGKTPLVQSIPFCLGYNCKFREDVREKCRAVALTYEHDGLLFELTRTFSDDFHITVASKNLKQEFFSEKEFSLALFKSLGMATPTLIGANRSATQPYVSTLLPLFFVRQDGGYTEIYRAPASFIADQFAEMIRFAFGLSPKRSYEAQRELNEAKEKLELLQRRIVFQQKVVAELADAVDDSPIERDRLRQRTQALTEQISDLKSSVDAAGSANTALLELLQSREQKISALRRQHQETQGRLAGIGSIRSEIEGEIRTLSLNEESRFAFESFFEICGRSDCRLFATSTESYAKSLLYLKDQIKDLDANERRAEIQLALLEDRIADELRERDAVAAKLKQPQEQKDVEYFVAAVQSMTRELLDLEQQQARLERLLEEKRKYVALDEERFQLQDRIATLTNRGRSDFQYNSLRARIGELTTKWMDVLATPNASRKVEIDLDFRFKFGTEPIDAFAGSTRSRLILAVHAAIFEHYLENEARPFRFLILDTPKQHELHSQDLREYLETLQALCDDRSAQVLMSSTEYRHRIGSKDAEWVPSFPGPDHPMYLGKVT